MERIQGFTMSDEQVNAYLAGVDELIKTRQSNGAMLSVFDLIAGAALVLFAAGRNDRFPAEWALAAFRPGLLPDGIMEKAIAVQGRLDELEETLEDMGRLASEVQSIQNSVGTLRQQTRRLAKELQDVQFSAHLDADPA